jgi:hypothetical protein
MLVIDMLKEVMKERINIKKGEDVPFHIFSAHVSSLVDRGVVERSSFDILGRHFDAMHAEKKGWKMRHYEGVVPELEVMPVDTEELKMNAKHVFVNRLAGWLYGGCWYSNLALTSLEYILQDIGREEIPPTPEESKCAEIEYDTEYKYPETYKISKIIYGTDAAYPRILPPGECIEVEKATNIIENYRKGTKKSDWI